MTIERVTDQTGQMLDNRIEQFRDKERFADALRSLGAQVQALEDALGQLITERSLDEGAGAQLDGIGRIVGEQRAGRTDAAYRFALRTRIALNISEGTIEDLLNLALAISGGTQASLREYFPAALEIRIIDPLPASVEPARVGAVVTSARPAGVKATTVLNVAPVFQFDTGSGYDDGQYAVAV